MNVDVQDQLPDGWTLLEATVVYKALDEIGVVRLGQSSTPAVSEWEVAGMLLWALDSCRQDLQRCTEEPGDL